MHENGGTTAIDLGGGDLIVLNGVAKATLSAGDFILGSGAPAAPAAAIPAVDEASDFAADPPHYVVNRGFYLPIELLM